MNTKIFDGWLHIAIILAVCQSIISQEIILVIELILMLVYVFIHGFYIEKSFLILMGLLLLHSGLVFFFNGADSNLILKQIAGIVVSYSFFFNIIHGKKCRNIVSVYLFYVKILAAIGIVQELAYLISSNISRLNLSGLYNFGWLVSGQQMGTALNGNFLRVDILFQEPSFVAYFFAPAMYLAIYKLFNKNLKIISIWDSFLILIVYILTFSSVAYVGIILSIAVIFFNRQHILKKLGVLGSLIAVCVILYNQVDAFKMRVDDTAALFLNDISGNENVSSVTLYTNFTVMLSSLTEKRGLGWGLGNYSQAYKSYVPSGAAWYGMNIDDGNSLLIRIITELGILGLCWLIIFCCKYKLKTSEDKYGISAAIFVFIILKLLRHGHYFIGETVLFFILYRMVFMEYKKNHLDNNGSLMKNPESG